MCKQLEWLPRKLDYNNDFGGNWDEFISHIYNLFCKDFLKKPYPRFDNRKVECDRRISDGTKKEDGFWHLVDCDEEEDRLPDLRRAEKLPWARGIIDYADSPPSELKVWGNREKHKGKKVIIVYMWLEAFDYVVILKKLPYTYMLVSGYHIKYGHKRRELRKKYKKRIQWKSAVHSNDASTPSTHGR